MDEYTRGLVLGIRRGDCNLVHTCFEYLWKDNWLRRRLVRSLPIIAVDEVPFYASVAFTYQRPEKQSKERIKHWCMKAAMLPKNRDVAALRYLMTERWILGYDIDDFPELGLMLQFNELVLKGGIAYATDTFLEELSSARNLSRREERLLSTIADRIKSPGTIEDSMTLRYALVLIGSRGLDPVIPFVIEFKPEIPKLRKIKLPWYVMSGTREEEIFTKAAERLQVDPDRVRRLWQRYIGENVSEFDSASLTTNLVSLRESRWFEPYRQLLVTDIDHTPALSQKYWREHAEPVIKELVLRKDD